MRIHVSNRAIFSEQVRVFYTEADHTGFVAPNEVPQEIVRSTVNLVSRIGKRTIRSMSIKRQELLTLSENLSFVASALFIVVIDLYVHYLSHSVLFVFPILTYLSTFSLFSSPSVFFGFFIKIA